MNEQGDDQPMRCPVFYAPPYNRCVRERGHQGPHLTDTGFAWKAAPADAPPPHPEEPEGEK